MSDEVSPQSFALLNQRVEALERVLASMDKKLDALLSKQSSDQIKAALASKDIEASLSHICDLRSNKVDMSAFKHLEREVHEVKTRVDITDKKVDELRLSAAKRVGLTTLGGGIGAGLIQLISLFLGG